MHLAIVWWNPAPAARDRTTARAKRHALSAESVKGEQLFSERDNASAQRIIRKIILPQVNSIAIEQSHAPLVPAN